MPRNAFVFVVCGQRHVDRLRITLKYLRHFSESDIIVVSRTKLKIDCDQMVAVKVPSHLDDHRASIFLKTSLHKVLPIGRRKFCYLDNDVIAVNRNVDKVFEHACKPISFAADHTTLREFGRFAVKCRCAAHECEHLHSAIRNKFGVKITEIDWRQWNGGVFVFDRNSTEFMKLWHKYTLAIFSDPYWHTRDQGTLAATAWKLELQHHPVLPQGFNFIVDPFKFSGSPRSKRKPANAAALTPDESYSIGSNGSPKPHPSFLHFINDGIGKSGWKNWDEVELLLAKKPLPAPPVVTTCVFAPPKNGVEQPARPLSADNLAVHGMWIGQTLSKMELLTIHSFLKHGHEFHLWLYEDMATPLPKEVVIEDANEIIPQKYIRRKTDIDPESGVGKGSYAPFSDLFRYKLLYEKGGYWVDMDVTCLRPFNFQTPYLFRAHRVGVVGNIMKCPPRSRLMQRLFEKVSPVLNEQSEWLMTNRMLSEMIRRMRLTEYIRADIWNAEDWWGAIRPLALEDQAIPQHWFAIHWINEFWSTVKQSGGIYREKRLFEVPPDKEQPKPTSALARLFAQYLPSSQPPATTAPAPVKSAPEAPLNRPAARQPLPFKFSTTGHVNIAVASLARGGAERNVIETFAGLKRRNIPGNLFVLNQVTASYAPALAGNARVFRLHGIELKDRLRTIAAEVLASSVPVLYTHLIRAEHLRVLWEHGVKTVPVIQNSREGWQDPPSAYTSSNVPFVAAVSDAVAMQLRENGCARPVVVIRHELQRWFTLEELQKNRAEIRDRYGIADGTLLIGMVGQFRSQKAYTRAVRVLAQIRQRCSARLMILGGWDHDWGHGRQAYLATHQLALELGVITEMFTPGPMPDPEKYYPAFDVFLNTSVYEGLSVSLLEAIQTGCPVVTADAGGNREVLPVGGFLVKDPSDIADYVRGIEKVSKAKSRMFAAKRPDFDLVPNLWLWLARYGASEPAEAAARRSGILFLTDNLNIGGAQRSLINLLGHLSRSSKTWLCVLETIFCQGYLDEVERGGTTVLSTHDAGDYLERVERILSMIDFLKVRDVCFWNVDPRIKLLLAKILPAGSVRLTDVSPGPFMMIEMESAATLQRRLAFSTSDYWNRLDHFVAKYSGGIPKDFPNQGGKAVVIPNGVNLPANVGPIASIIPKGAEPGLVIGAVCRIAPGKRIDFLIEMMTELNRQLSGVNLVIVGGVDPRHASYWDQLIGQINSKQLTNIHFAGPHHDVTPFLRQFKVFVMMAETPGCPNASLEAMAMGIPVVANSAGGTGEQVLHGINGFLVGGSDPKEMSRYVRYLLVNHQARRRLGAAAKITAEKDFSMNLMAQRYSKLFEEPTPDNTVAPGLPGTIPARRTKIKLNNRKTNPVVP